MNIFLISEFDPQTQQFGVAVATQIGKEARHASRRVRCHKRMERGRIAVEWGSGGRINGRIERSKIGMGGFTIWTSATKNVKPTCFPFGDACLLPQS